MKPGRFTANVQSLIEVMESNYMKLKGKVVSRFLG